MKSKIMKQKETETVFSRRNYIILLIGFGSNNSRLSIHER